jgi:hypothetical protein
MLFSMRVAQFEKIFRALEEAKVDYVVVGGMAVIAHGVVRFTNDLDLVMAFDEANLLRGMRALESLGFKPRVPVPAEDFAKVENRRRWASEKNMMVFQMALLSEDNLPVDIFIEPPFDVGKELARAPRYELAPGLMVPVLHLDRLIEMKQKAGRPRDLDDVASLKRVQQR